MSFLVFFFFENLLINNYDPIFFFQLVLILKEPKNDFLVEIYEGQQRRIQVVIDEIMEIEELLEV